MESGGAANRSWKSTCKPLVSESRHLVGKMTCGFALALRISLFLGELRERHSRTESKSSSRSLHTAYLLLYLPPPLTLLQGDTTP